MSAQLEQQINDELEKRHHNWNRVQTLITFSRLKDEVHRKNFEHFAIKRKEMGIKPILESFMHFCVNSGSAAEVWGLNFACSNGKPGKGSDVDIMMIPNDIQVLPPGEEKSELGKIPMVSRYGNLKQSIRLKCLRPGFVIGVNSSLNKLRESLFQKQSKIQSNYRRKPDTQGPALKFPLTANTPETDLTFAVECTSWPQESWNWPNRVRKSGWPTSEMIRKCGENLCYIVLKVDRKDPKHRENEWRYSYSQPERYLINNFSNIQGQTYLLAKLIFKNLLINEQMKEAGMSSYILKTAFLHFCEEYDFSKDKTLTQCLEHFVEVFIANLRRKKISHYFIESVNLLRFIEDSVLKDVRSNLQQISTNFNSLLQKVLEVFGTLSIERSTDLEFERVHPVSAHIDTKVQKLHGGVAIDYFLEYIPRLLGPLDDFVQNPEGCLSWSLYKTSLMFLKLALIRNNKYNAIPSLEVQDAILRNIRQLSPHAHAASVCLEAILYLEIIKDIRKAENVLKTSRDVPSTISGMPFFRNKEQVFNELSIIDTMGVIKIPVYVLACLPGPCKLWMYLRFWTMRKNKRNEKNRPVMSHRLLFHLKCVYNLEIPSLRKFLRIHTESDDSERRSLLLLEVEQAFNPGENGVMTRQMVSYTAHLCRSERRKAPYAAANLWRNLALHLFQISLEMKSIEEENADFVPFLQLLKEKLRLRASKVNN